MRNDALGDWKPGARSLEHYIPLRHRWQEPARWPVLRPANSGDFDPYLVIASLRVDVSSVLPLLWLVLTK